MPLIQDNEQALCKAMIALLETRYDGECRHVSYPERDGSGPPVEVRFKLGDQYFAIEHTLVEPFPEAIPSGIRFQKFVEGIVSQLDGALPTPGAYQLVFPKDPTLGHPPKVQEPVKRAIVDWVLKEAANLHAKFPRRADRDHMPFGYDGSSSAAVCGIDLSLRRQVHWASSGKHDGRLFIARDAGTDVEGHRAKRLRRALDDKLPKLAACAKAGDTTVLILEFSDVALSNHILIAQALEPLLAAHGLNELPTHIFIAETTSLPWHFFHVFVDRQFSMEMKYQEI